MREERILGQACPGGVGVLGVGGFAGVRVNLDGGGPTLSFAFFGFFASRPRLSRLPMCCSSTMSTGILACRSARRPQRTHYSL